MKLLMQLSFFVLTLVMFASVSFADHSEDSLQASQAYESGDFKKAYQLWLIEAEKGDASAQVIVGAMYASGKGVTEDYEEAVKWYRRAAEQGYVNAQVSLGNMYFEGQGTSQSYEHAYAWWLVAAANGNQTAKHKREVIQNEMTPDQIQKAQHLAIEILLTIGD